MAADADLREAFELMEVGDVLLWDVEHLRGEADRVRNRARIRRWKVKLRCNPPLRRTYAHIAGRLTIKRLA